MIATFFKAAGIENADEVLNSFKTTGTGALHRQPVMSSSTVSGAVSSVAQIAASSHPAAKTVLSAIQLILTAVTTKLSFDSAELRLRNAGTEEIMPLGKADASPSAKTGPNVLGAAATLIWRLPKIRQCVQRMEKAQVQLDAAKSRLAAADISPTERLQAEGDIRAAGENLSIEYARFCLRNELKTDYKTASESAKIEYEGNKRYLGISGASAAFSVTATILGILPHAAAAAVTGGVSAAAVTAVALMYVGYQLSSGPSKDGEAKAKRAIVALGKSLDLLGGNASKQQKERAQAYQTYIKEKRLWRRPEVRVQAKAKLLAALDNIACRDTTEHDVKPLANWSAYADYRQQMEAAAGDPHAMQDLEVAFTQAHQAEFKVSTLADSWKTPYRMRLDSMGRILLGKSSKTLTALLKSAARNGHASSDRTERSTFARAQIHAGLRADVKVSLRDWISFELAQANIKSTLSEEKDPATQAGLQSAARALSAIKDLDVQALFTGDGRGQVAATELAKKLTAGEVERYTITNAGSATLAGAANIIGATVSLGLNIKKEVQLSHGIHASKIYNNQNDARVFVQGTAPVTAPYISAERARFQKTGMAKLLETLARNGDPVSLKLEIAEVDPATMDMSDRRIDVALDKLMDDLERLADLPDDIKLSIGGINIATGKLRGTSNYFNWRYKHAPAGTKAKFQMRRTGMIVNNMHASITSPISQIVAQVPLSMTRHAANRGQEMSHDVRDRLTDLTRQPRSAALADGKENDKAE
ncbi:putative type III effector protein [Collimonas pratensis]|uniref:Putative type III effector protein n=2 Tax=Collimonas pratensis TaxID=279113 RepID=A0A127QAK7_9BURK|nr:putative type III effector protein [Collimonas pratensis]